MGNDTLHMALPNNRVSMIRDDTKGDYCREERTGYLATFKYHNANITENKTRGAF